MAEVDLLRPKLKADLVCIRCVPPHIKPVCNCKNPKFIPIERWLHLDENGHRDYLTEKEVEDGREKESYNDA